MQFVFKHSTGMTVIAALLLALFYGCDRSVNLNDTEDTMTPAVPQNAAVTWAYDGTVDIDWKPNPELNIKGYNIYRSINDTLHLSLRSFTSNSYFTDDSLSYDSVYYYRVSAVTIRGLESMKTPWLKAQPVNLNPPVTPKFLEINARNWNDSVSVFLKWQPNFEGDIAGYKIYKSENHDFTADTNSFAGFSSTYYFTDKKNLQLYKRYYYRIKAVDKGGLSSQTGPVVSDIILEKANAVYPLDNSSVDYFREFKIRAVGASANYRVIVQSNQYFGEIWSKDFSTNVTNDTVSVLFDMPGLSTGTTYYWRIITFSPDNDQPNSISNLFNFTIKP